MESPVRREQKSRIMMRPREIHRTWSDTYESDPYTWGDDIVFFRIQPGSMWAYAFHPEKFGE